MDMIGNDGTIYFVLLYIEVQKINRPKNTMNANEREKRKRREKKSIDWLGKRISPSSHTLEKSRSIDTV
jgi:hypothetical protein